MVCQDPWHKNRAAPPSRRSGTRPYEESSESLYLGARLGDETGDSRTQANRGPTDGEHHATAETRSSSADRLIESFHDAGNTAFESVRKFLDTVNGAFPDVSADDGPRQKIIDAAFKMTEQIVGSSTKLAEKIVKVTPDVVAESDKEGK